MTSIREYEATLSLEMLEVLQTAGATVYGMDDPARLAERVPTFCFNLPNVAPRSSPKPCRTAASAFATATCTRRG